MAAKDDDVALADRDRHGVAGMVWPGHGTGPGFSLADRRSSLPGASHQRVISWIEIDDSGPAHAATTAAEQRKSSVGVAAHEDVIESSDRERGRQRRPVGDEGSHHLNRRAFARSLSPA